MKLIVDIQGFYTNEFILKEITIIDCTDTKISHFILKPPYPWHCLEEKYKYGVMWLQRHHHGLNWSDGFVDYEEFMAVHLQNLLGQATNIYVKGLQKKQFLLTYLNIDDGGGGDGGSNTTIIDLPETLSLSQFKSDKRCVPHSINCNIDKICSTNNAYKILSILNNN